MIVKADCWQVRKSMARIKAVMSERAHNADSNRKTRALRKFVDTLWIPSVSYLLLGVKRLQARQEIMILQSTQPAQNCLNSPEFKFTAEDVNGQVLQFQVYFPTLVSLLGKHVFLHWSFRGLTFLLVEISLPSLYILGFSIRQSDAWGIVLRMSSSQSSSRKYKIPT